ncbi:RNA polymerase sigma factor [Kaarinaea lacus]
MSVKASEIKLISRVAASDEPAFAQLYATTSSAVYRYLKRLSGDADLSNELLIKTYQLAWQTAADYNQKLVPTSWLISIARELALSSQQLADKHDRNERAESENIAALDRQRAFLNAMDSLPVESRDSLVLVLTNIYTYHAISEITGLTIDDVKARVFDAKNLLNEKLKKHGIKKYQVSKSNILRELIPLYINGALSGKHKIAFEKSLKNDPNLKQEYLEFYEIESYFDQLDTTSKQQLDRLYSAIKNSLEDLEELLDAETEEEKAPTIKVDFLEHVFSSSRIGWGVAIFQFLILVLVLTFGGSDNTSPVEPNITATQLLQQSKGKQLNLIFKDEATHLQIRKLLLQLEAETVAGPTEIGLYTVEIDGSEQQAQDVLNKLRMSDIVLLADPAY